jgi:primosomal protein N' (replication factor Y) (superfamily II helicase)
MASIAQVEPLTSARALRGPFDYALPDEMRDSVGVGSMLVVPFGRRDLLGVVVALADGSDVAPERLLAPRRAVDGALPVELVELAGWIALEYCSTPARALSLVLPPGAGAGVHGLARLVAKLTAAGRAAPTAGVRLSARQREVLERLAPLGEAAVAQTGADHGTLRRLEARGLVRLHRRAVARVPEHVAVGARRSGRVELGADQRRALDSIEAAIASSRHEALLVHGVTGSGKTELYLRAAEAALAQGRGAIVLVPEIGLTPQTVSRFVERFGDVVAVAHSRLGAGERYDEWMRLRSGEARICVGPRSAVFAPVARLGLVVVDEEHDSSYKHEGDPRYDARHVAERRAQQAGAVLLAGSATPRPESYARLRRLALPERVDGGRLPAVEVLDMRGRNGPLHECTAAALAQLRRGAGKGIVLLNRRGWSNFLSCRACGKVWGCPECDVALVLHRAEGEIACHHCGHRRRVPVACDACGSRSVARHGLGTERLEHELAAALGGEDYPIFRLDADVAAGRGRAAAVLSAFERAPAGVLIGTQMVAKGHDFDGIALGVVLDADATLRFPDFRAEERTFALVAQLAGRAGRGGTAGRVLVQTLAPGARAIAAAARHDSEGFLEGELRRRRALSYPPYGELIRIVCSSARAGLALEAATDLRRRLEGGCEAQLLGPAPLFRLRGRDRAQLVVKAADRHAAVAAVGEAVARPLHREVAVSVDVDPQ